MHGIHLRALELMICEQYGENVWEEIKELAKIRITGNVLVTEYYSDRVTYQLAEAAQQILRVPLSDFWEMVGEYFVDYVHEYGYSRLLSVLGGDPVSFLENLDTLHFSLGRIYPLKAPLFNCEKLPDGSYLLHYYSQRSQMLEHYVMGLIRRAVGRLFNVSTTMSLLEKDPEENHSVFSISFYKRHKHDKLNDRGHKGLAIESFGTNETTNQPFTLVPRISQSSFAKLCPFHLLMDTDLTVTTCGSSILRMMPEIVGRKLDTVARMIRPWMPVSTKAIKEHLNSVFVMELDRGLNTADQGSAFKICGQMYNLSECNCFLFIGSLLVTTLDDLHQKGFHLADLPLHDAKRDFILASEHFAIAHQMFQQVEELTQKLLQTKRAVEDEKLKTEKLIYAILPQPVAMELKKGRQVVAQRFECVTILFGGIVGFEGFCISQSGISGATEVITLLNQLYTTFDHLLERNRNCYKVETVLDKYMVVSGAPEPLPGSQHSSEVISLAFGMRRNCGGILMDGKAVKVTLGIHSGEIVAGVIGNRMPRYCLFGDTVNTTSRIQTSGPSNTIKISERTLKLLQTSVQSEIKTEYVGQVHLKGKSEPLKLWTLHERTKKPSDDLENKLKQQNRSILCQIL